MKVLIVPKRGLKIPVPGKGRALAAEGEILHKSHYWIRRKAEGDVEILEEEVSKQSDDSAVDEQPLEDI